MRVAGGFTAFVEREGGLGTIAHSRVRFLKQFPIELYARIVFERQRNRFGRPSVLMMSGDLCLMGLGAEIVFRLDADSSNGSHERRAHVDLIPVGQTIPIPTQSVLLALPEGSDLWVLTQDPTLRQPWYQQRAGSIGPRASRINRRMPVEATLDISLSPDESRDGRETRVDVSGEVRFERELRMRLVHQESRLAEAPPPDVESVELRLLPAGASWQIDHRSVSAAVGPNPWISVRVVEAGNRPLCDEHALGRSMRMQ